MSDKQPNLPKLPPPPLSAAPRPNSMIIPPPLSAAPPRPNSMIIPPPLSAAPPPPYSAAPAPPPLTSAPAPPTMFAPAPPKISAPPPPTVLSSNPNPISTPPSPLSSTPPPILSSSKNQSITDAAVSNSARKQENVETLETSKIPSSLSSPDNSFNLPNGRASSFYGNPSAIPSSSSSPDSSFNVPNGRPSSFYASIPESIMAQPTSSTAGQSFIVSVELSNGSVSKFNINASSKANDLLKLVAAKFRIQQPQYFGFLIQKVVNNSDGNLMAEDPKQSLFQERLFLADNSPIGDQIGLRMGTKFSLCMKYSYLDVKAELLDDVTLDLIFHDVKGRFLKMISKRDTAKDSFEQASALLLKVTELQENREIKLNTENLIQYAPKIIIPDKNQDELIKGINASHRSLAKVSGKDAIKRFLIVVKTGMSHLLYSYWEIMHMEFRVPMILGLSPEGILFHNAELEPKYFIPYKTCLSWDVNQVDLQGEEENGTTHSISNLAANRFTVGSDENVKMAAVESFRSSMIVTSAFKKIGFGTSRRTNKGPPIPQESALDGKCKSEFVLKTDNSKFQEISCIVYSSIQNHHCVCETISYHANNLALDLQDDAAKVQVDVLDDPANVPAGIETPLTCTANYDYIAKTEDELMFMKEEVITILEKLGNGFYMGECKGIRGVFKGHFVTFKTISPMTNGTTSAKPNVLLRKNSANETQFSAGEGKVILNIRFLDQRKVAILISSKTTGKGLREMIIEKMELSDHEFFDVADETNYPDRWLHPNIPITLQGVTQSSLLIFKARCLYRRIDEITDPKALHLYFAQAKHMVLSGIMPVSETDALELAGIQLQATLGDNDPEKHKPGYLESLSLILAPQFATKLSLTKNENWWQKKAFSSHVEYRGLPTNEAERLYVQTVQRQSLYGYSIYNLGQSDSVLLGISREDVITIDKNSKAIVERYKFDGVLTGWKNISFTLILREKGIGGMDKQIKFFSFKTFDILEEIDMIVESNKKSDMRKTCKEIRNTFSILKVPLNLPFSLKDSKSYENDPENLAASLKDGSSLCALVNILNANQNLNYQSSEFHDLATYLCLENISSFLSFLREELKIPEKNLFLPEELYNFDVNRFSRILSVLGMVLQHEKTRTVLSEAKKEADLIKERNRHSNLRSMRDMVINEIISTERNFVADLENGIFNFYEPLTRTLSEADKRNIFLNWLDLYEFQKLFLKDLEAAIVSESKAEEIANVFTKHVGGFEDNYTIYCAGQSDAAEILISMKDSTQIAQALSKQNLNAPWHALLASCLIKPVQRILKYHLLLRELSKNTDDKSPEKPVIEKALIGMQGVAQNINEIKRFKENQQNLKELQKRIEGYEGTPIVSLGDLVLDGNVVMFEKIVIPGKKASLPKGDNEFHFFLFKEALICCKEYKKKQKDVAYKFKQFIPMNMVLVKDKVNNYGDTNEMTCGWELVRMDLQKTFIMICKSLEEKQRWVNEARQIVKAMNNAPSNQSLNELDKNIIESERKNRIKNNQDVSPPPPGEGKIVDINGTESNIPSELPATDTNSNVGSRAQSITGEQMRLKYEQAKEMRSAVQMKLVEESSIMEERLKQNSIHVHDIQRLLLEIEEVRDGNRKLEADVARDRYSNRLLEDRLSRESIRRDELVKLLQGNLQSIREIRALTVARLSSDDTKYAQLSLRMNELAQSLLGTGKLAVEEDTNSKTNEFSQKEVLKL